jgi:hypothetical protein
VAWNSLVTYGSSCLWLYTCEPHIYWLASNGSLWDNIAHRFSILHHIYFQLLNTWPFSYFSAYTLISVTSSDYQLLSSSGTWRCVVHRVSTNISDEHIDSIFTVEEIGWANQRASRWLGGLLAGLWNLFLRPWRWRRYVPPKRRLKLNRLHSVISQKIILFTISLIC